MDVCPVTGRRLTRGSSGALLPVLLLLLLGTWEEGMEEGMEEGIEETNATTREGESARAPCGQSRSSR